jgi:hypothetical protein
MEAGKGQSKLPFRPAPAQVLTLLHSLMVVMVVVMVMVVVGKVMMVVVVAMLAPITRAIHAAMVLWLPAIAISASTHQINATSALQ